jgi:general secretion pathway protein C
VVEEEDLEATKLPVRLLGTAASFDPKHSWAAVEDLETRKHQLVRVHDPLKQAKVIRIERRRIVIENGQRREELALDDAPGAGAAGATGGPGAGARNAAQRPQAAALPVSATAPPGVDSNVANRVRKLADNRFAVNRNDVQQAARNPAQLFQQARILPKWENGQMVGVQLNAIQTGSLFEQIGIQSGDTITMMNGVRVDSPENSAGLIRELTESRQFNVVVRGNDGRERTLTYEVQE